MNDSNTPQNPIVELASRLRARRDLAAAIDSATTPSEPGTPPESGVPPERGDDAADRFEALAAAVAVGAKRLNSILGIRTGVTIVRMGNPPRLRLRFRDKRIALDLDAARQLVVVSGDGLDGEYQPVDVDGTPALVNLSILSTDEGYGDGLTASALLKRIASDAELPRPAHLDGPGPLSF